MSAMPTPSESPVVTRPSTPGFDMSSEDDHIIEIDVESVLFDVSRGSCFVGVGGEEEKLMRWFAF